MPITFPRIASKSISMRTRNRIPILTLAAMATLEAIWAYLYGYRFVGLAVGVLGASLLGVISLAYGLSGRSTSLSAMAYFGAMWVAFTLVGSIFTYATATLGNPLLDAYFTQLDEALGFHWLEYYAMVESLPALRVTLMLAYSSLIPQVIFATIYFSSCGIDRKSYELWWTALVALSFTAVLSGLFPAAGTFQFYGVGLDRAVHLAHFNELRNGRGLSYAIREMQGIVTFPSYHVALAVLLILAFRGTKFFPAAAILNVLILMSTPVYGGHYLVDMIAGGVVAFASFFLVRKLLIFKG